MVTVTVSGNANVSYVMGHGLTVDGDHKVSPYSTITPHFPETELETVEKDQSLSIQERGAVSSMLPLRTFALRIETTEAGQELANKTWNAMWHFHLLSLSCGAPAIPLFCQSGDDDETVLAVTNRHLFFHPLETLQKITEAQCDWAADKYSNFWELIKDDKFSRAMRYFGNSHYLPDLESRIMLLWAGVESLFNLDAEQSRRVALYAAILHDKPKEEKIAYAERVRKAYHVRSRIVHGSLLGSDDKKTAYADASEILARILSKCVALGRIPERKEYDQIASAQSIHT